MTKPNQPLDGLAVIVAHEAIAGQGEDDYAASVTPAGGVLCVADGCGGLGGRRYAEIAQRTEAFVASRLAVQVIRDRLSIAAQQLPQNTAQALTLATQLQDALAERLQGFHAVHHNQTASRMVVRGLQRTLPTTLCLVLMDARREDCLACVFLWAGDSRGFVLTDTGLRQCTADHVAGVPDALENLYRDARLTNMVHADGGFYLETYGMTLPKPCVVLTATDGVFSYLPTPMEFELLLLQTLHMSASLDHWQTNLRRRLARIASDDSTLAMACFGFATFDALKAYFQPRRKAMQTEFVTPVRRRKQSLDHARLLWAMYRQGYELSKEARDADWRL